MATTPWVATINYTTGQVVSAANANAYWRDNLNFLATPPGCQATQGTQSLANVTQVAVAYNGENWDTDSIHSNITNNSRFTVPANLDGTWRIEALVSFTASAGGTTRRVGFNVSALGVENGASTPPQTVAFTADVYAAKEYVLSAGQWVEVFAFQDSGAPLVITSTATFTRLSN
jgi:hypothetical protein